MESVYYQSNSIVSDVQKAFRKLDKCSNDAELSDLSNEIDLKLQTISKNCDKLEILLNKVPLVQRSSAKVRLDELRVTNRHLKKELDRWRQKQQKKRTEPTDRDLLFSRRTASTSGTVADTENASVIEIDYSLDCHTHLQNTNRRMDEILMSGASVLETLRSQRYLLGNSRQRMFNIANSLGISDNTIRLIQKRVKGDKYVFYGGIFVTITFMIIVMFYFR